MSHILKNHYYSDGHIILNLLKKQFVWRCIWNIWIKMKETEHCVTWIIGGLKLLKTSASILGSYSWVKDEWSRRLISADLLWWRELSMKLKQLINVLTVTYGHRIWVDHRHLQRVSGLSLSDRLRSSVIHVGLRVATPPNWKGPAKVVFRFISSRLLLWSSYSKIPCCRLRSISPTLSCAGCPCVLLSA